MKEVSMDSSEIECMCAGCGITHQFVREEISLEPVDDGEFEVVTNCNCTECGQALIIKGGPVEDVEEEPPEF